MIVVCTSRKITLTKYIYKCINIYDTKLTSIDRYFNLVFYKIIWRYKYCTYFLQIRSNLWHEHQRRQSIRDGGSSLFSTHAVVGHWCFSRTAVFSPFREPPVSFSWRHECTHSTIRKWMYMRPRKDTHVSA
jgi:hypothetical protein